MRFVYVVVILGAVLRLVLLVLRPPADRHFDNARRRLVAKAVEHGGDAIFLVSAVLAFAVGRQAHTAVALLCIVGVLIGLAMVALAYDVARRSGPRPRASGSAALETPSTPPPASRGNGGGRHRAPPPRQRV